MGLPSRTALLAARALLPAHPVLSAMPGCSTLCNKPPQAGDEQREAPLSKSEGPHLRRQLSQPCAGRSPAWRKRSASSVEARSSPEERLVVKSTPSRQRRAFWRRRARWAARRWLTLLDPSSGPASASNSLCQGCCCCWAVWGPAPASASAEPAASARPAVGGMLCLGCCCCCVRRGAACACERIAGWLAGVALKPEEPLPLLCCPDDEGSTSPMLREPAMIGVSMCCALLEHTGPAAQHCGVRSAEISPQGGPWVCPPRDAWIACTVLLAIFSSSTCQIAAGCAAANAASWD